jgi:hypothetical protein
MMKNNFEVQYSCLTKYYLILILLVIFSLTGFAQSVGISPNGVSLPNASAGLDVNFSTQGILVPRVALTGTTSFLPLGSVPVAGMVVYNTATILDVTPGLYFNDGIKWVPVFPKASNAGDLLYWDGATWKRIPIGTPGQKLQLVNGIPTWV